MQKLQHALIYGTGKELDNIGELLDLPRMFWGEHLEPDGPYRERIFKHKMIRLLLNYSDPPYVDTTEYRGR
jgi:hypothetical protein